MRRVTQPPASPPRASAFVKVAILVAGVLAVALGSRAQFSNLFQY